MNDKVKIRWYYPAQHDAGVKTDHPELFLRELGLKTSEYESIGIADCYIMFIEGDI